MRGVQETSAEHAFQGFTEARDLQPVPFVPLGVDPVHRSVLLQPSGIDGHRCQSTTAHLVYQLELDHFALQVCRVCTEACFGSEVPTARSLFRTWVCKQPTCFWGGG